MVVKDKIVKNKSLIAAVFVIFIMLVVLEPWKVYAQGVTKVADLPFPLYRACCALGNDGNIYVFGGLTGSSTKSSSVIRFNPNDKSVSVVADLGNGFEGGWAVNYNGKIYVGSGYYGSQPTKKIFIFDPSDNSISTVTSPTSINVYSYAGHGNIGAFTHSNKIYVFYGIYLSSYQSTVKIYNINNNTATTVNLSISPTYYSISSYNGLAYIVGCNDKAVDTGVLVFNPTSNTLVKEADFPYMAGMATCFGSDGIMYAIGGCKFKTPQELKSDIIKYDPVSKTHVVAGSLPVPRWLSCAALANNGKIYVFGGLDSLSVSSNPTTDILEIDPSSLAAPPGDFVLSGTLDNNDADLTWTVSSSATDYILERSTDGTNFSQLIQTSDNTYTDPNLTPGTYYYRVKAQNNYGTRMSNVITLTVQVSAPNIPVLSITLDDTDAYLSWTSVQDSTNYILERSTDGTNFRQLTKTSGNTYTDSNLTPGKYYYRVRASNAGGTSEPSNVVSVTIQLVPPSKYWVFWPAGGQYVEVDWNRGNIDLTGDMVQLWREDTVSGIWLPVKDISDDEKDSFTWFDTNVMAGLNYKYQVRVYDPSSWDWRIAAESEWAVEDRPFPAPGGLRITSTTDSSATITWTPISGATRYQIRISIDGGESWGKSTVYGTTETVTRPCMVQVMAGTHARSQWSGILRVQ